MKLSNLEHYLIKNRVLALYCHLINEYMHADARKRLQAERGFSEVSKMKSEFIKKKRVNNEQFNRC